MPQTRLKSQTEFMTRPALLSLLAAIALLLGGIAGGEVAVRAADQKAELTLGEFRALIEQQIAGEKPPAAPERGGKRGSPRAQDGGADRGMDRAADPRRELAGEVFFHLLSAQAQESAARQSLDRLSGWLKTAEARLQTQSAPATDANLLRLYAARASARVARFEAQRLSAVREANALLNRPPATPVVAVMQAAAAAPDKPAPDKPSPDNSSKEAPEKKAEGTADTKAPAVGEIGPDFASRKAQYEKVLLPMGAELLAKMYQSYLFGGMTLTSLLGQEAEVYRTELEYRLLVVEANKAVTSGR